MTIILWRNTLALAIGVAGYLIANLAYFPAPALTGPALLVSIASVCGVRLEIHSWLRNSAFIFIGIAMGTSVTPDVIHAAKRWPESFLLLAIAILMIFFLCRMALERIWKFDRETSTLASTPGHMSYIMSLLLNSKADIATVSVVQSIRVLALTLLVPAIVALLGYESSTLVRTITVLSWPVVAALFVASVMVALLLERLNLAASFLLAGMAVSSLVFVTGTAKGQLPLEIYLPTIVIMGTIIGTRLSGVSRKAILNALGSGVVLMLIAILCASGAAALYAGWSGLPFAQLLIAFAPGGLETMIAMSLLLDADPAFVAAHHVWRLIILTILAPMMLARR